MMSGIVLAVAVLVGTAKCSATPETTTAALPCIANNYDRTCCAIDSSTCDVDCSCELPDSPYCAIFGCTLYASLCSKCFVPPTTTTTTTPSVPVFCLGGGIYCSFDFCCPAAACAQHENCFETTTVTTTEEPTTTEEATTTEVATTTEEPTTVTKCAYNDFLTTTRILGITQATSCQGAPGFVSINVEVPGADPLPICSAVLVSTDTIFTSDFCLAQVAAIPEVFTVAVNAFNGEKVATIPEKTGTDGQLTLDAPVTFDGASCLLPACVADHTMELDMTSCKMFSRGRTDEAALKSGRLQSAPISITGTCGANNNLCSESTTTAQTCEGDAGGPLICPDQTGQLITAGLVADMPPVCTGPPDFISLLPDIFDSSVLPTQ